MTNQQQTITRDRSQDESPLPPIPFSCQHAHHFKWILLPIYLQNASPGTIWCRDHRGTLLASFFFFVSQPGTLVVHATSAIHPASHSVQYGAQLLERLLHPSTYKYAVNTGDIYFTRYGGSLPSGDESSYLPSRPKNRKKTSSSLLSCGLACTAVIRVPKTLRGRLEDALLGWKWRIAWPQDYSRWPTCLDTSFRRCRKKSG
ncbi:hypothetical protein B0T13DRAFT_171760 [Neurospora crassa]|nr:hypothetical protein B0T13DRAFT_171760 [Neurospora crassa]